MNLTKLKTNYDPKKKDLEWAEEHLKIFRTGQYWVTSHYTVLVDKENKLLKLVKLNTDKDAKENLARLIKVLHQSEWKVIKGARKEIEDFQNHRADFAYYNVRTGIGYLVRN